ncbi:DICT sensory domain-containing protein [Haloarchaeobius amylolyticus]|uniref:DICT sensory domain-containing protein n=1 Tax=Haloarchaeobius amylolyticus TaxID=1198296 RepID=UPI00226F4E21|nr:DICT sensory domain-containing protein [Haloarchaeobius amylolyticus]
MSLLEFIHDLGDVDRTLTVVNRTETDIVQSMLEELFEGQPVTVTESGSGPAAEEDRVLVDGGGEGDGGPPVSSSLESIGNAVLFVNSDTYISGSRSLDEVETPEAILKLADTPFSMVGYPDTRKQKFLLIEISRYIEAKAWQAGTGAIHSGFQTLSRINDERGTRQVYDKLASTGLDVHVYGIPNWTPGPDSPLEPHGEDGDEELRRSWFVIFQHPTDPAQDAGLVCYEVGRNEWQGFWTFDHERVDTVLDYVTTRFHYGSS